MIAVVVRSYSQHRVSAITHYLTHGARHLAAETSDGRALPDVVAQFTDPATPTARRLTVTQLALSLDKRERGTTDVMFAAGRALLTQMQLVERPWIGVLHGPPADAHLHLHLLVRIDDPRTGERVPLARLPRAAFAAATAIAPRFGWCAPAADEHERRREPRGARSLGVWHGERSLHAWLGEIVGDELRARIDAATTWASVGAALATFGLRYERTARGAVIADCSRPKAPAVAASALAFRASANALERRFGPTPTFPVPDDAVRNPRAFANDHAGRTTGLGTPEERYVFLAEHATWQAVWLPVRLEHLRAQRACEDARRDSLQTTLANMRHERDRLAQTRAESVLGTRFIRAYRDDVVRSLREQARTERAVLNDLPFARRPPSRLLEWLRQRDPSVADLRRLCGPSTADVGAAAPAGFRLEPGLAGGAEWWRSGRRVAIDAGREIVVCDAAIALAALLEGHRRWGRVRLGGDQPFRDIVATAAERVGLTLDLERRPDGLRAAIPVMPQVSRHVGVRRASAIAQHLGLREVCLDGGRVPIRTLDGRADDRRAPSSLEVPSRDVLVLCARSTTLAAMERAAIYPAVVAADTAIFTLPPDLTDGERDRLAAMLAETYGVRPARSIPLDGDIRYGPAGVCAGIRRLLAAMRPPPPIPTFAERVHVIERYLEQFVPSSPPADRTSGVQQRPEAPTQTRRRGARSR